MNRRWVGIAALILALATLMGCDERMTVTATPSPEPTPTPAQGVEERIAFAPGAISATVERAVVLGARDRYLLEAMAGQRMLVALSALEDNAEFQLLGPDGAELTPTSDEDGVRTFELPQNGDYVIVVGATRGNATYRLRVTIPSLGAVDPLRINFEPGASAALIEGRVEAGGRALTVLEAVEEQYLTVSVMGESAPLALGVQGEDGTVFLPLEAGETALNIVALPASMDYFLEIAALGEATDFQLTVSASQPAELPERLTLQTGEILSVSGILEAGGDLESYIMRLEAGQLLEVEVLPQGAPLSVYLQSEDGEDFFFAVDGRLAATAPRALDYVLMVSTPNAAGETAYELRIGLEPER